MEVQERESAVKPRPGLSVEDTIAANANLSVGGRGADTSGVRMGAGAGAGSTHLSPAITNASPAANIASGPSGSMTPGMDTSASLATTDIPLQLSYEEVAAHAYRYWEERGCPDGSPEEDWHRAENELRELRERRPLKASAAGA